MLFVIILGFVCLIVVVVSICISCRQGYYRLQNKWLVNEFSRCNVIVFGKKGTGKDLLFAHVIHLRDDLHYSNIEYDGNTELIDLLDVRAGDNSFINLINGTVNKFEPNFVSEKDIYISDAGIFLPCQYNNELNKRYQSMPLLYALSRHLYQNNIHVNTQALNRVWDKLREQADSYIKVCGNVEKRRYFILEVVSYDTYESALRGLLPCRGKQYKATNGEIKKRYIKLYKKELYYDTHYFAKVFFEEKPDIKQEELKQCLSD